MLKNKIIPFGLLLFSCLIFTLQANCQNQVSDTENEAMQLYMKQFRDFSNTNKNAQALEVLQKYAILKEVALNRERDSVVKTIQEDFLKTQKGRSEEISAKENKIVELKAANEDIDRENIKMTRNTLLFFGILIGVAVLILLNRFKSLAKVKEQFELSNSYLKYATDFTGDHAKISGETSKLSQVYNSAEKFLQESNGWLTSLSSDKQNPLSKQASALMQNTVKATVLLNPGQAEETGIKVNTDLNELIEEVIDQAYYFFASESPEFSCEVIRDLEKILPKIEIIPEEIRLVVFNLLMNAFYSVNEKRSNAPKGYQPKVTISTRKLPRFVQIRIKDNGTGIQEKDPNQLLEPFYSRKKSEKNPGLGLSESARIINVVHKGELIIESDPGNGSDFIIRFTTLTLS